jgi:CRP-like cAMP-binding protein
MIKDGTVSVDDVGDKFKAQKLGPGSYFGERALMTNEPRAATVTADTHVTILALDKESFQKLLGPLQDLLDYNLSMRVLSSITLFEKLTTIELDKLCRSFEPESFSAGTVIIQQGDRGRKFYVLVSGTAKVVNEEKEIATLGNGDYFGELALLDDEVRKATVVATTDCKCFNIDRPTFNRVLGSLQHVMERETASRYQTLGGNNSNASSTAQPVVQLLNLKFNELQHIATLGSGTFGRVTLVQDKATKSVYALKALLKSEVVAHKQQENVMNEKNVMMRCNSPFVLKLFQTFKDPKKLYMLLEFVQGGELFSVIHKPGVDGVPDAHGRFYALGVTLGIAHLHSQNIAYRDMKPENCLVDSQGYPKLVDFGFAKVIVGKSFTLCGTPEYLAPELVLGRGHNKAVDYWALGVMIYEMQCGYSPYADESGNMDHIVICRNIVNGKLTFGRGFNSDCKVEFFMLLNTLAGCMS